MHALCILRADEANWASSLELCRYHPKCRQRTRMPIERSDTETDYQGQKRYPKELARQIGVPQWGCDKWGFKACLASSPGNQPNRPFSPFFCLFSPFPEGPKSTWKIQKTEEKGLLPRGYPRICLSPRLLNSHFWHSKQRFLASAKPPWG